MPRATKIVATLGPASSTPEVLDAMLKAGVDVVRLNFSHGKAQDHIDRARLVREAAARVGKVVAIMADLQGPKIRVGKFAEGKVMLEPGQAFILDASRTEPGDIHGVGLDYKELPRDVKPGDILLLNDGLIVLTVEAVQGEAVHTVVKLGGELSNNKGINKQGGGLTAPALTAKDMDDIKTAASFQCDYIAVSFPKNATDMEMARQLCNVAGEPWKHRPALIAKIERTEAIPNLEAILKASDGIMVARGDLAVEVGNAAVPCRAGSLHRVAAQRARFRVVDLHIEFGIVFKWHTRLLVKAFRPVQIVNVFPALDKFTGHAVERVVKAVASKMAHHFAFLAPDGGVVEHVDADFVVIPRIVRRVLEMPNEFASVDV